MKLAKKLTRLFALVLLSLWFALGARASEVDSLLIAARSAREKGELPSALFAYLQAVRQLEKENNAPQLANTLLEIGLIYQNTNLHEKAIEYLAKAHAAQADAGLKIEVAEVMAFSQVKLHQHERAISSWQAALAHYQATQNQRQALKVRQNLARSHHALKQYSLVAPEYEEALRLARQLGDQNAEAVLLNNQGYNHKYLKNYPAAFAAFRQALALQEKTGMPDHLNLPVLINLGITSQNVGDYASALQYLQAALRLTDAPGLANRKAEVYDLLALVHYYRRDTYNAKLQNEISIAEALAHHNRQTLQQAYKTRSLIFQEEDDYQQALDYYKKHLALHDSLVIEEIAQQEKLVQQQFMAEKSERDTRLMFAAEEVKDAEIKRLTKERELQRQALTLSEQKAQLQLAQLQQQEGEQKQAQQNLLIARQQTAAAQQEKNLLALQTENLKNEGVIREQKLGEEKKEQEINLLTKEKQVQAIEVERQKEATRNLIWLLGLGMLIMVLALFGFFKIRQSHHKLAEQKEEITAQRDTLSELNEEVNATNQNLAAKNEEIERKNHTITDSINYAKRIQQAMLPDLGFIKQHLPEFFVFYRPKDIVSGDFYWFSPLALPGGSELLVLAAADCTGHGVPGSIMSMLGANTLNQVVHELKLTDPAQILLELDRRVRQLLKQEEYVIGGLQDGMDMAICVWDPTSCQLHFSGAKRPLLRVRAGELTELAANRHSIGGGKGHKEFTTQAIELLPGDRVYLYTDGITDQFNHENRKRLGSNQVKKLLTELSHLPLASQEAQLAQVLDDWRGQTRQTDDLLLIGFGV